MYEIAGRPRQRGCPIHSRTFFANEWALRTARVTKGRVATHDRKNPGPTDERP